ncbi:MAG TPA: YwpF family protein [Chondromyces sp.]|nr:YwpF family protein [Chondromyces sp.]
MKTFKVVSIYVEEKEELRQIDLIDGLIINREDERQTWLIELFVSKDYYDYFRDSQQMSSPFDVRVTISHPENDPAFLTTRIICIKQTENRISVLLEGQIKPKRYEYIQQLLSKLVKEGKQGEDLIQAFKTTMNREGRSMAKKR